MKTVLAVIAEDEGGELTSTTLECVQEARQLADKTGGLVQVLLPGFDVARLADPLSSHGADRVLLVEHEALRFFSAEGSLAAIAPILGELHPVVILAPDSSRSRSWLPRLALRLGTPLATGCLQLQVSRDGGWKIVRPLHGGLLSEHLTYAGGVPLLATLRPDARGLEVPLAGREAEISRHTPDMAGVRIRDRTLRHIPADPRTVDVREADRIVAAGMGVDGPPGVALVQRLAEELQAALGATRPVVDRGWIPIEREIGVTGKKVAPRLYVALGISGAIQHTMGMADSETVIALNIDPTAPIFGLADLGVVGDLHQVVPEVLRRIGAKA